MIPKIIWQTHESEYKNLFPFQKNIINTWKILNPDWEHRYTDSKQREQDVKDYNETLYKIYQISSGINKADIWRMVAMYTHGGVYADMDSICTMPLDEMLEKYYNNEDLICSSIGFQTSPSAVNNSNFATTKNSQILKMVLDNTILKCENMLKHNNNLPNLSPGVPVYNCFSNAAVKNKNIVCFQDGYFIHSKDFKDHFDLNTQVMYNGETVSYLDIAKQSNLPIY
jgi:hypothetical protein